MTKFAKPLLNASLALLLGTGLLGQAFAGEQLKTIQEKGVINVGLEGTYPPFSFQDENGKLTGFEVELSELLAKELGVKAKVQPTKWDGILAALESKRLDVVINQVTISEERKKKYDFSEPYTVSGIQALVLKGSDNEKNIKTAADLAGKKVGVGLGTNYEQWVKQDVPTADVRTYEDDPTKFADLRNGRIDAILIDRLAALEYVQKTAKDKKPTALAGEKFSKLESGVALRKGETELLDALNKAIDKLKADGTLAKLSEKYFGADVTK
ncbi:Cystine ABC transporter [Pseudomonas putida]|nr:Cystine ABC transporter [Pseudomonas putida]